MTTTVDGQYTAQRPPVRSASFSSIRKFERCPYAIYLQRVERCPVPEPSEDSPLKRGERVHLAAEQYVRGDGSMVKELIKVADEINQFRDLYQEGKVELEEEWGFTKDLEPCAWRDGGCWLMVKCDVVVHHDPKYLEIVDYKTGKRYGKELEHQQQCEIYAMAGMLKYPEVDLVKARLIYTDEGKDFHRRYDRALLPGMVERWSRRINQVTNAMVFKPKPTKGNCRFCDYGVSNGSGICPYAVEYS